MLVSAAYARSEKAGLQRLRQGGRNVCGICTSLVLVGILVFSSAVRAEESPTLPSFDAGTWKLGLWAGEAVGKSAGHSFGDVQLTMAGFHIARVIHSFSGEPGRQGALEYTFEAQPLFLVTGLQTTYGGGFSPAGLKWQLAGSGRYRPYIEWNGGMMFTPKNVPPGDTSSFNFTTSLGPGMMIYTKRNRAISVAVRFWHLSNADMGNTNPSYNTIQFLMGFHWLKSK
jgi:hypothetical protein